jgi:hypothetical protein
MRSLQKFKSAAAAFGGVNAALYAIHRSLNRFGGALHRYEFVAQPVASHALLTGARGRSIAVRLVDADDPVLSQLPLTPEVIARRAAQGAVCFGAFKGEEMIGCLWLCLGTYEEDEVRCRFVPAPVGRASWDFDVYLRPDQRLGPGFARLWDEGNAYLRERGIRWSVSRISAFNPRSLAAHARLGTRGIGSAIFLCLGRVQFALSSVPPYVYFSRGPGQVPLFVLDASRFATKHAAGDELAAEKL